MSTWRFFFESDDDPLRDLIRWRRLEILKSTFWTILSLLSWNEYDESRSSRREHYRTLRYRHSITFDHETSSTNWHDIENDCNDIETPKYRPSLTRNSRWLWRDRKVHWFDLRKNHENLCEKISNETHRKFAWFLTTRVDRSCFYVLISCTNLAFCHQVCRMIWPFWCFVDPKRRNFFRRISRSFDVCWPELLYAFESSLHDLVRSWEYFASCRWYSLFWRSKVAFSL